MIWFNLLFLKTYWRRYIKFDLHVRGDDMVLNRREGEGGDGAMDDKVQRRKLGLLSGGRRRSKEVGGCA